MGGDVADDIVDEWLASDWYHSLGNVACQRGEPCAGAAGQNKRLQWYLSISRRVFDLYKDFNCGFLEARRDRSCVARCSVQYPPPPFLGKISCLAMILSDSS